MAAPFFVNEIDVGANPARGNTHLYRRFIRPEFVIFFDPATGEINTATSYIKISYLWYYKASNGIDILDSPVEYYYLVMDVPGHPNFTNRLTQLWRTPIDGAAAGLADNIEFILLNLPFDVPQGYTLNT